MTGKGCFRWRDGGGGLEQDFAWTSVGEGCCDGGSVDVSVGGAIELVGLTVPSASRYSATH